MSHCTANCNKPMCQPLTCLSSIHRNWARPRSRVSLLLFYISYVLQFLAQKSSLLLIDCRGITGEFNCWYPTRQLLQALLSSASKLVFPYSRKTSGPINYAFSFFKKMCTYPHSTRLAEWACSKLFCYHSYFSLFLLDHLSADSVYKLNVSRQTSLLVCYSRCKS